MFSFYFLILLNAIYKGARIPMYTASLEGKYVRLIGTNTKKGVSWCTIENHRKPFNAELVH